MNYLESVISQIHQKLIEQLQESDGGVHAETAIAVMAGLTATMLVAQEKDTLKIDLDKTRDKSILQAAVEEKGKKIKELMLSFANKYHWNTNFYEAIPNIPKEHEPKMSVINYINNLQENCWAILRRRQVGKSEYANILALATLHLIKMTEVVLPTSIGLTIALCYLSKIIQIQLVK